MYGPEPSSYCIFCGTPTTRGVRGEVVFQCDCAVKHLRGLLDAIPADKACPPDNVPYPFDNELRGDDHGEH